MPRWKIALSMLGNVCCVVGVVAANKHVQVHHGFGASSLPAWHDAPLDRVRVDEITCSGGVCFSDHAELMTAMHFAFTALGMRVLCSLGFFPYTPAVCRARRNMCARTELMRSH